MMLAPSFLSVAIHLRSLLDNTRHGNSMFEITHAYIVTPDVPTLGVVFGTAVAIIFVISVFNSRFGSVDRHRFSARYKTMIFPLSGAPTEDFVVLMHFINAQCPSPLRRMSSVRFPRVVKSPVAHSGYSAARRRAKIAARHAVLPATLYPDESRVETTFGTHLPEIYLDSMSRASDKKSGCSCPCGRHSPPFSSREIAICASLAASVTVPRISPSSPCTSSRTSAPLSLASLSSPAPVLRKNHLAMSVLPLLNLKVDKDGTGSLLDASSMLDASIKTSNSVTAPSFSRRPVTPKNHTILNMDALMSPLVMAGTTASMIATPANANMVQAETLKSTSPANLNVKSSGPLSSGNDFRCSSLSALLTNTPVMSFILALVALFVAVMQNSGAWRRISRKYRYPA